MDVSLAENRPFGVVDREEPQTWWKLPPERNFRPPTSNLQQCHWALYFAISTPPVAPINRFICGGS